MFKLTHYQTFTNAPNSIVIGLGDPSSSNSFLLTNSTPNSLMVGFNSNIPTLFVSPAAGLNTTGAVCIGDTYIPGGFKLAVNGKIIAEEVNVKLRGSWPDFVFDSTYALLPMDSLRNYVSANKHLPGVPAAAEMQAQDGVALGQLNTLYMQKIEELTLYMLQLQEENAKMQKEIEEMKAKEH